MYTRLFRLHFHVRKIYISGPTKRHNIGHYKLSATPLSVEQIASSQLETPIKKVYSQEAARSSFVSSGQAVKSRTFSTSNFTPVLDLGSSISQSNTSAREHRPT